MKKYLICIILFCSCQNKQDEIVRYLTGDSVKYWTVINEHPIRSDRQGMVLYSNGIKKGWWDNHDSIGRFFWPSQPEYLSESWILLNDSVLWIGFSVDKNNLEYGIKCKIEYINEDILILNGLSYKGLTIYMKSKDQKTELAPYPKDESNFNL